MLEQSRVVRKLTKDEITDLISEIKLDPKWVKHYDGVTALQDGTTLYLQQFNQEATKLIFSNFKKYPKTHAIIKNIAGDAPLGRCYWHKLMPGDKINRHDDLDQLHVINGSLANRYQIYLKGDDNFLLEMDNAVKSSKDLEFSVVDFALTNTHFYQNNSNQPWVFLVFDVLHKSKS